MKAHISRTYSGAHDLQSMVDLLVAVRPPERVADSPGIADLREMLALNAVQANTRLWFGAEGKLVGFAFVDQYQNLRFEIEQHSAAAGIETEIVAWGVACIQRLIQARGEPVTLDASCREENLTRIALLERHGFVKQAVRSIQLARPLDGPIPTPRIPPGFRIRHVAGEHEVEALVELHRAAFGTENMTIEERLAMMRGPEYETALDLLVMAPDGRYAAYCLCSIYPEENVNGKRNVGYTDPLATHPDFRRCGLARALLLTGFHKLKQCGVAMAKLGTSSENVSMLRTAEAAGFRIQSTTVWFAKPVSEDD